MPKYSGDAILQLTLPNESVQFDAEAFDEFVKTHGVQFVLHKAMRCPIGMIDADDVRRPHPHHANCVGGFLLMKAGYVTCAFVSNTRESHFMDAGRIDGSNVVVTLPRFYDKSDCQCSDDKRVEVSVYDRLYFADESMTVPTWQTVDAHVTGVDRLLFPVVNVEFLVDSNGKSYVQDQDFIIQNGQIVWTTNNRPGIDPKNQKGVTYSVRYHYRPYYYVKQVLHEIRLIQKEDVNGERHTERLPQQALLAREIFFEKEQKDLESPNPASPRQQPSPESNLFGPR